MCKPLRQPASPVASERPVTLTEGTGWQITGTWGTPAAAPSVQSPKQLQETPLRFEGTLSPAPFHPQHLLAGSQASLLPMEPVLRMEKGLLGFGCPCSKRGSGHWGPLGPSNLPDPLGKSLFTSSQLPSRQGTATSASSLAPKGLSSDPSKLETAALRPGQEWTFAPQEAVQRAAPGSPLGSVPSVVLLCAQQVKAKERLPRRFFQVT